MRAVIYCRVSTDEQREHGTELKGQAERCRAYSERSGFQIVAELEDAGISGKIPVAERPAGAELYRLISSQAVDAVMMTRADRLSRDEYGIESGLFNRLCDKNKVSIHLVDEGGLLRSDLGGRLLLNLGDRMGGEERKKIADRGRIGRLNSAKQGNVILTGHGPYGYRKKVIVEVDPVSQSQRTKMALEIHEQQAAIVQEIFKKYTEERLSIRAIARYLNTNHIAAPRGQRKPRPGKNISEWHCSSLQRLLRNRCYIGEFVYSCIVVPRPDLAIIDRETFNRAQKLFAENKANSPRRTTHEYLWRSRIKCECGYMYSAKVQTKYAKYSYKYYRCTHETRETSDQCQIRKTIFGKYFDDASWSKLLESLNPEVLKQGAKDYVARQQEILKPRRERLDLAIAELTEAQHLANEYVRLAGRLGISESLLAKYEQEAELELARVERLTREVEEIRDKLSHVVRYDEEEVDRILTELNFRLGNGNPTFEQKRKFIEWANVRGQLEGENVRFTCEIGIAFSVPRSISSFVSHSNRLPGQAEIR